MAIYQYPATTDTTSHTFLPADAARVAASLVAEDSFLSALIGRSLENDLLGGGKLGRTVNIKVPHALIARTRDIDDKTTGIILDELRESTVPVTLGTHALSAVSLSEEDLNFNIQDFASQVLAPQTAAVADVVEDAVAKALASITLDTSVDWDAANPTKTFTQIRKVLRQRGVPQVNLQMVVGTNVYAALLDAKAIEDASQSGSTEALREGNVGKVRGFQIVESTRVDDDEIVAFHKDAFVLAVRAPAVPQGANFGATVNDRFPLRYLRDYDAAHASDRSIVSTFLGVVPLPLFKIERDYTTGTATTSQVAGGGAFRMSIGDAEA